MRLGLGATNEEGVQGGPGGLEVLGAFGEKRLKHEKTRKTLRSCMARLLCSNIQHFVQEVTSQVSNTPPKGRRIMDPYMIYPFVN